jgi:hypothetical protein
MKSESRADSRLFGELLRSLTAQGIAVRFRARGRSMYPAISDNDVVQVEAAGDNAERGDVVLVEGDGALRVHRIVSAEGDLRTRGDCCFRDDGANLKVIGTVKIVSDDGLRSPARQSPRSILRRWVARWRGHF